jgi:hypothetical protein
VPKLSIKSTCIEELHKILGIKREEIKGDLELQLPWDPLPDVPYLSDIHRKLCRVEVLCQNKETIQICVENLRETFERVPMEGNYPE